MSNLLKLSTRFFVCRENLDIELISAKLGKPPSSVNLSKEIISIKAGASRDFDSRLQSGYCVYTLTNKQSRSDFDEQVKFWIEWFFSVKSGLEELSHLGYSNILDLQIVSTDRKLPSMNFQLTKNTLLKLAQINIDISFTSFRPVDC
jgi:hypothetical protein